MAYTAEQLHAYFDRIGLSEKYGNSLPKPVGAALSELQNAHMNHIPYENVDIVKGVPLSLTEEGLFDKMVQRKRGGYCFEQNGLLYFVLASLGFSVTQFCGRFILGSTGIPDRRHRVLRVEADDGVFIVDAGVYGESPRTALRFVENEVQNDGICAYRFTRDPFYGWIQEQKEEGKSWKQIYGFTEEPWLSMDFVQPSFFCEKHPESAFTAFYKIGIFRGRESLTFLDSTFTVYSDGKIRRREEIAEKDRIALLKNEFLLEL